MCGIAGIFSPLDPLPPEADLLRSMMTELAHRGPDDLTFHLEPGLGLGCHRLAIVDLAGGRQPIQNEDGSIVMVCNGEIYDHRVLRQALQARGHRLRAEVDVEVLVHLYEELGLDFLDGVNGQFAFGAVRPRPRPAAAGTRPGRHCAPLLRGPGRAGGVRVRVGALRLYPLGERAG